MPFFTVFRPFTLSIFLFPRVQGWAQRVCEQCLCQFEGSIWACLPVSSFVQTYVAFASIGASRSSDLVLLSLRST